MFVFSSILVASLSLSSLKSSQTMRRPTHRSPTVQPVVTPIDAVRDEIIQRTIWMNDQAKRGATFAAEELDCVKCSLLNVYPKDETLDCESLEVLLKEVAHLSHKDWEVTGANSQKLTAILLPEGLTKGRKQVVERILTEGNWEGALSHASTRDVAKKPWAVLVTGVNGIRKTTSMYQSWFKELLREAISGPGGRNDVIPDVLPDGTNSFFRQLDFLIATLCNEEFAKLYSYSRDLSDGSRPSKETIQLYSNFKAAIFTRFRTLSELFGVALLREAQAKNLNCMVETSGRDVAMFHYVDTFFPSDKYNKLALHFTINDLAFAENSVDRRMVDEIEAGINALPDIFEVIKANKGGPYGSEVLASVQSDSDNVWTTEVLSGNVGSDWYTATIAIEGHDVRPWGARAVRPSGELGRLFEFAQ